MTFLESELARLQRENRELVNAILVLAGVPAIESDMPKAAGPPIRGPVKRRDIARRMIQKTRAALGILEPLSREQAERKDREQHAS